jgi:DNA-binding MarR family transcriptional regulator
VTHPVFEFDPDEIDGATMEAFRAFKRAMMLHRRLLMSTFAEESMHPAQAGCLQALAHRDGMSQSDLAEMLHVSRPTVTTMLQRMDGAGVIERRADESDSRVTRVYLTEAGRALADRMHAGFVDMLNLSMGSMSDADTREFTRILSAVNDHVESVLKERGVGAWVHPGHGEEGPR